jgi:hypothetical protein
MKRRAGLGVALLVCAAAEAAEPAAVAPAAPSAPPASIPKAAVTKPLDLRIGNVRRYMPPEEYRAALGAPDADKNTVVVEAQRELLPVKYERPIPPGLLMAPIWALMNPKESWRILLPDINHAPIPPPDVVPPPIFRWGP